MNPLIIAKNRDKWGYAEPTNENIQIAIDSCETYLKNYDGIRDVIEGIKYKHFSF